MASEESAQERLVEVLVRKIAEDRFPSPSMMSFVEQRLGPQQREEYLSMLLDKIENDRFPSLDMMRRVERLAG